MSVRTGSWATVLVWGDILRCWWESLLTDLELSMTVGEISAWMEMRESIVSLQSRSENSVNISNASRLTSKSSSQWDVGQVSIGLEDLSPEALFSLLLVVWKAVSWLKLADNVRWMSSWDRSNVSLKRQSIGNLIKSKLKLELEITGEQIWGSCYLYPWPESISSVRRPAGLLFALLRG